ncbi:MAG: hypothetical protein OQK75_05400, partial [Gammaproteobacteria bacterium]|nr:hypothetical protein [Gammaproteobacteria bacterium]
MPRIRIGNQSVNLDINPASLARQFDGLQRIRQQMLHDTGGNTRLVDQYLMRRLTGAVEHFSSRYAQEMSQRLDSIFNLRDQLSSVYQSVLNGTGETVTPAQLRNLFGELRQHIGDLHSPTEKARGLTNLEPGPPPAQIIQPGSTRGTAVTPDAPVTRPHDVTPSRPVDIDPQRPLTPLERTLGEGHLNDAQRSVIQNQLNTVHPQLLSILANVPDSVRSGVVRLFSQQFSGWTRWNLDAIRGVIKLFEPARNISRTAIYRMFQNWSSGSLNQMLISFNRIADMPGANHIFSDIFTSLQSGIMIDIYISISRLQLPQNITPQALLGMLNLYRQGKDVHAELLRTPPSRRLQMLEDASPLSQSLRRVSDSVSHLPEPLRSAMSNLALPIRSGINLLEGSTDSIVRA